VKEDIIGFIRVMPPRYTEAGQRAAMAAQNITRVVAITGRSDGSIETIVKMTIPGTVIAVLHALLLANPRHKRKKGGTRKAFWTAFDAIEAKGGTVWELYTGLRTSNRAERDTMTREAIDALARGRHKTSTSDRRGRPPKEFSATQLEKARAVWESRKHRRWADVEKHLPKGMTLKKAWQLFGPRNVEE